MSGRRLTPKEHAWLYAEGLHAPTYNSYRTKVREALWRDAAPRLDPKRERRKAELRREIAALLLRARGGDAQPSAARREGL